MVWRTSIYLLFLFYYICNGQIVLAPFTEPWANMTLKQKLNGNGTSIKALKAKMPYEYIQLPSQWSHEPEAPYYWPEGQVKYYIDSDSYGEGVESLLLMAFNSIRFSGEYDCPKFVQLEQKPNDGDWLHFTNPDRMRPCVHEPGINRDGEIKVVLGYDCLKPRDVMHTVMHGLGFRDEITHPERDLFVRVMWDNIQPAFRHMFRIQSVEATNGLAEYDPMSIMHFHDRAYSVNGQATIMPVLPGLKVEPSDGLSHLDTMKIRRIFDHECKKLQIGNILNSCGTNNNIDVSGSNDNAEQCGNGGREDQIVVPGKDVQPEGENEGSIEGSVVIPDHDVQAEDKFESSNTNEGGVVIPGHDVQPEGENEGSIEGSVVIPGHDVQPEGENEGSIEGSVVIPGHDVQPEGENEGSIEGSVVIPGHDVQSEGENKAGIVIGKVDYQSGNETSIVIQGNDVSGVLIKELHYKGSKYSKGKNKLTNAELKGDHGLPSDEAIIVGYNEEFK